MNITYNHSKQLAFSPAFTFVIEAFASMLRDQLVHPCFDWGNASEVVWATDSASGKIVCAQVFAIDGYGRCFTHLAYTLPDFRGHGLAAAVFEHLEKVIKARPNVVGVYTTCVDENGAIKQVFEKTGRDQYTAKFVKWYKDVEQL